MTIQSARGPPGRAEEPGASLKTGLVEWRLARARASTPFGERSLCYQSRFADANSAARERSLSFAQRSRRFGLLRFRGL